MATAGVLQVHPSLRCNLRCHHCYSSSGPDQRGQLDDATLADLVSDAAALGYATLAVSGGEPLMFPGLDALLRAARDAGMRTMVTTNGTLLTPARLRELAPVLDLLAFSLDGPADVHNAVRASPWAFTKLERGLGVAERHGIAHGVLYTATVASVDDVPWGAQFASDHGCELFQVHAIEDAGRAHHDMRQQFLGNSLLDRAAAAAMAAYGQHGGLRVHVDLARRTELEGLRVDDVLGPRGQPPLLIVEADGAVVPMTHGFARGTVVADLRGERLGDAFPRFLERGAPVLAELIEETRQQLLGTDRDTFDFYAELRRASHLRSGPHQAREIPVQLAG